LKAILDSLKNYQDVLSRIAELEQLLSSVPPEIQELESEWKTIESRIQQLATQQDEQETKLKTKRLALEEATEKERKFEKDLQSVTNNKEYQAVIKEIDASKKTIHSLQEEIAKITGELEQTRGAMEECRQLEKESSEKYQAALSEFKGGMAENDAELAEKTKQRDKLAASLPDRVLRQFSRIADRRAGVGLSLCLLAVCQGCNVRVRQNVVDQLRKFERIIQCDNCKRILYFSEAE